MPLFVVRFEDHLDKYDVRLKYLKSHINWLDENKERVLVGGSLRDEPDAQPLGALWIVRVDSKRDVEELVNSDPFWSSGLRKSMEILYWSKAFEDRLVEV